MHSLFMVEILSAAVVFGIIAPGCSGDAASESGSTTTPAISGELQKIKEQDAFAKVVCHGALPSAGNNKGTDSRIFPGYKAYHSNAAVYKKYGVRNESEETVYVDAFHLFNEEIGVTYFQTDCKHVTQEGGIGEWVDKYKIKLVDVLKVPLSKVGRIELKTPVVLISGASHTVEINMDDYVDTSKQGIYFFDTFAFELRDKNGNIKLFDLPEAGVIRLDKKGNHLPCIEHIVGPRLSQEDIDRINSRVGEN